MMPAVTIQRNLAILLLTIGLIATGCGKKSEPTGKQKAQPKVNGVTNNDYDEGGYPVERNRSEGVGSTKLHDNGTEELIIPLREANVPPRVEIEEGDDEDGWSNFFRSRNTGVGSTRVNDNGTEELIIPLRELKK